MSALLPVGMPLQKTSGPLSLIGLWLLAGLIVTLFVIFPKFAYSEVLTPRSDSAVIARFPETHLVLRQPPSAGMVRVQVGDSIRWLDPVISADGADGLYQHYRLPLAPGNNMFRLQPGGEEVSIDYQPVQSELNLRPRGKNAYFFHQDTQLPEDCRSCHDLVANSFDSSAGLPRQDSCMVCHNNQVGRERWQHSTTLNHQCLKCHSQPEPDGRIGMPKLPIRELCFTCHTGKKAWTEKKVVHGPLNLGGCTLCHGPHGGDYPKQLWADGALDLCIACHSDMAQLVAAIRERKIPYVHNVLTGPGCVACHDPHATDQIYMLKAPINELCSGCHPGPATTGGHPIARHPVSGPTERLRPNRELSCTSCHEPHGSYNRYLLIESGSGGRLCRECHGQ